MHLTSPLHLADTVAPTPPIRALLDVAHMPARELVSLMARARSLNTLLSRGDGPPVLRARNLVLVCEDEVDGNADLLRVGAAALGAAVTTIRPGSWSLSVDIAHTARVLGRLYDIVVCERVDSHLLGQLEAACGVPVFDGIARWSDAPTAPCNRACEPGSVKDQASQCVDGCVGEGTGDRPGDESANQQRGLDRRALLQVALMDALGVGRIAG